MLMLHFFYAKAAREHGTHDALAPEESSLVAQGGSPENEIVQHLSLIHI